MQTLPGRSLHCKDSSGKWHSRDVGKIAMLMFLVRRGLIPTPTLIKLCATPCFDYANVPSQHFGSRHMSRLCIHALCTLVLDLLDKSVRAMVFFAIKLILPSLCLSIIVVVVVY